MYLIKNLLFVLMMTVGTTLWAADAALDRVNINTADAETLALVLDGVGETRARAIVTYRETHGGFQSADELTEVRGIGTQVVDRNRERIETDG